MSDFNSFLLPEFLATTLDKLGFKTPTPIQAQTIPEALLGKDVLGSAQTGTGKTLAFMIPVIAKLLNEPTSKALILTPTRELAQQVMAVAQTLLGDSSPVKYATLIGGENIFKQFTPLRHNPRLVIGTPGRIIDHLGRKTLDLTKFNFLVLDETDRMLDMGFGLQLQEIIPLLPDDRQTLMFTATLGEAERVAKRYLNNPVRVAIEQNFKASKNIKQDVVQCPEAEKYPILLEELEAREGSVIIFVKTKRNAQKLADRLQDKSYRVAAIHGDLRQRQREQVLGIFRQGRIRIMVATDVAARGLDVPHIQHVINFDLPQVPEDYIHRIGRTARAGATGHALNLVSPQDHRLWKAIERMMDPEAAKQSAPRPGAPGGNRSKSTSPFKPKTGGFKPKFGSDKPKFGGDRGRFGDDKPKFGGDKPKFGGDRPKFGDDKPRFGGDKPKFGGDRPKFGDDKPRFGGDKPKFGGDKPKFSSDKPKFSSEKPKFGGDRPRAAVNSSRPQGAFSGKKSAPAGGRPKAGGEMRKRKTS